MIRPGKEFLRDGLFILIAITDMYAFTAGRIDVRVHFGNATQSQAAELFGKFYPDLEATKAQQLASEFAAQIPDKVFSMAHLQGFLMGHKGDPEASVREIGDWVKNHGQGSSAADSASTEQEYVTELDSTTANQRK